MLVKLWMAWETAAATYQLRFLEKVGRKVKSLQGRQGLQGDQLATRLGPPLSWPALPCQLGSKRQTHKPGRATRAAMEDREGAEAPLPRNQQPKFLKGVIRFSDLLARGAGSAAELLGDPALRTCVSMPAGVCCVSRTACGARAWH